MFKSFLLFSNIMVTALHNNKINRGFCKCVITPDFVGKKFYISEKTHKMKVFMVTKLHVGHFFGEFIRTRTCEHDVKKKHRIKVYEHRTKKINISR